MEEIGSCLGSLPTIHADNSKIRVIGLLRGLGIETPASTREEGHHLLDHGGLANSGRPDKNDV